MPAMVPYNCCDYVENKHTENVCILVSGSNSFYKVCSVGLSCRREELVEIELFLTACMFSGPEDNAFFRDW